MKTSEEHIIALEKRLIEAIDIDNHRRIKEFIAGVDSVTGAYLIEHLDNERRHHLVNILGTDLPPRLLTFLNHYVCSEIIKILSFERAAIIIEKLPAGAAVNILEGLKDRLKIISKLSVKKRRFINFSLSYLADSAGRLMGDNFISVPIDWTVGQVIDYLRNEKDLPDDFYDLFIIDPKGHPVGILALGKLLRQQRKVVIKEIIEGDFIVIDADMDQEEVAYIFRQHDLTSSPVVDKDGRLVGVINIDDVVDVIEDEAEEDMMRMGGVSEEHFFSTSLISIRKRIFWLGFNLAATFISALVISRYTSSIEKLAVLAVLMPLVASMGGIAAVQTLTVTVRALATKALAEGNRWRSVVRESIINLSNGLMISAVTCLVVYLWFNDDLLALAIFISMTANFLLAGFLGSIFPLLLLRLGIDPAIAAGPCATVATDIFGFFTFLALASYLLF